MTTGMHADTIGMIADEVNRPAALIWSQTIALIRAKGWNAVVLGDKRDEFEIQLTPDAAETIRSHYRQAVTQ